MEWQIIVAIVAGIITMCATIIGGIWAIEIRFEKRLNRTEQNLRTEIRSGNAELRTELKADIADVKAEQKAEMKADKAEMKAEMQADKAELKADIAELRNIIIKYIVGDKTSDKRPA